MDALKAVEMPPEIRATFETSAAQNATDDDVKPSRRLDDLRAQVQTELDTQPLSTAMISRLFARLSADALRRGLPASPVDQSA
ncbi:MAG: hypothetical protein JWN71_3909 [Xanthobacteraceae bacterium]|nr:hypothetical protein [Xanthobacteraceae bacterium]